MSAVVDEPLLVAATSDSGLEGKWAEDVVSTGGLVAPHFVLVEAMNILRRFEIEGRLGRMEAGAAARDLVLFDLDLVPFAPFADESGSCEPTSRATTPGTSRWLNSATSPCRRSIAVSPERPALAAASFCRLDLSLAGVRELQRPFQSDLQGRPCGAALLVLHRLSLLSRSAAVWHYEGWTPRERSRQRVENYSQSLFWSPRPGESGPADPQPYDPQPVETARVYDSILGAVGGTPLIRLRRYLPDARFQLYAKLESLNPGGSIKDRPARLILEHALETGALGAGSVVIESSSGNMGIGLAQACRYYGLRFICVVDPKTTEANLRVIRAYGAEIDYVAEPDPESGEFLQARLKRVQVLLKQIEGSFWPNQYANTKNSESHFSTTMHEVALALGGRIDYLFVATSTCGTVNGCGDYVKKNGLKTRVIAVDAYGSLIFSDVRAPRMVPGMGAGLRPPLCDLSLIDEPVHVNDLDCVVGCRRLIEREAIFAGGSSGGVLSAVEHYRDRIPDGAVVVAILPDRGERYLETLFSDDWVREHFGEVSSLWTGVEAG